MSNNTLPLAGVRILELPGDKGALASRFLADLGADVVLIESPERSAARSVTPLAGGLSTYHEAFNANKRSMVVEGGADSTRRALELLLPEVDILFSSLEPRQLDDFGLDLAALCTRHPHLVVCAMTHFGLTGPWRDWEATEWVHLALGTGLSRSGAPGREPLMPPMSTALQNASVQASWAMLVAYAQKLVHGRGDLVDVAIHEAVLQVSDPPYGMAGSAAAGMPTVGGPRGRVDYSYRYPFFRAADGWVRIALLSARQWTGMYEWLGRPEAFSGDAWAVVSHRYDNAKVLHSAIAELFAAMPRLQVVSEAARRGVPAASVLSLDEVLREDHFVTRKTFATRTAGGRRFVLPDGVVEIDGRRAGVRSSAPTLGEHTCEVLEQLTAGEDEPAETGGSLGDTAMGLSDRPLAGVRVLDFGVIVAGGEAGRLFADLGADVIKIENLAVPDGSRPALDGSEMNVLFAWGNRNKRSLGLDVKSIAGRELVLRLVKSADVLLSNFKPGTLAKLGLDYEQLRSVNPRIVVLESSAFGHTGPWASSLGYGPVVRAAVGISSLWQYHDDAGRFFDDVTSYPDHVSARVAATSVLARLVERRRTGVGGTVHLAQAEVFLWQHSHLLAGVSLEPGSLAPVGNEPPGHLPRGVFAAKGDDEWVVVEVTSTDQREALVVFLAARAELVADGAWASRQAIERSLRAWIATCTPVDAMVALQACGVPAGKMVRVEEVLDLPQVVARETFRAERHPLVPQPMPSEGLPARFSRLARLSSLPAPVVGQHTREIARTLLLDEGEIAELLRDQVLQEDVAGLARLAAVERSSAG